MKKLVTNFIELLKLDILAYIFALNLVYALYVIDSTSIWFKFSQLNYDQLNTLKKKVQNIKVSKVVPFIKWKTNGNAFVLTKTTPKIFNKSTRS